MLEFWSGIFDHVRSTLQRSQKMGLTKIIEFRI